MSDVGQYSLSTICLRGQHQDCVEDCGCLCHDQAIESPKRVWLHVYADADCWCSYHLDQRDDPRLLTEYVQVDVHQQLITRLTEALADMLERPYDQLVTSRARAALAAAVAKERAL